MKVKIVVDKNQDSIEISQKIRYEVFVQEQGIPLELDLDGLDKHSYHALAYINDSAVGSARLALLENNKAVMARVAITKAHRGKGIAAELIESLLVKAGQLNINSIEIHAHEYLKEYYKTFGFNYIKQVEKVGEHQLIEMRLTRKN
ncbi:GNAT family N-acetyltransferase [Psychromonas aquimarina]|uniref:GNAT family N-acetyltransferase n=1 Tax=Psychromonas aquimarina TaxID=444919 RepID=UPI00041E5A04|nr:GNAT family N-acetyltransferase [Psychromonas aquimarina]